jgi:transposase
MIRYEQFCHIKDLQTQQGLKPPQIAEVLALDARTVAKWLGEDHYHPRQETQRPSKLDPFKPDIVRMLERHPYSATQIFHRISEQGFDGGYSTVKRYVRKVRPRRSPAFLTLSFAPGECAQVDWGSFGSVAVGSTRRRLSFFVMVLCYSRMLYVECTVAQTMEHFLACHQHAFEFLHAVPQQVMVDNLKSAVLKRALGQAPVLNPKYLEFAQHYGFSIVPCNVGQAHEKGRVENAVGYVKKNFLAGLEIPDFSALDPAVRHWLDTVANVRSHGETRQRPVDLLEQERLCLRPLSAQPFDIATVSPVRASRQFRITLDTNRYSVPAEYAGQPLTLKTYPDRLCLYAEEKLIARHPRSYDRHQDFEDPDHPKALLQQRKKGRDQKLFLRFLALSPHADAYYRKLAQRRMNPLHHVRNIVALSEIYPPQAVARALEDGWSLGAFSSEYLANLLEQRARTTPQPGALHLTRREDLLDVTLDPPDLTVYHTPEDPDPHPPGGQSHERPQRKK